MAAKKKAKEGLTTKLVNQSFHEVMHNTPSTVTRADVSPARKEKMKVAIALSKAREAGADIPAAPRKPKKGSKSGY